MLLASKENLSAHWQGECEVGQLFVIVQNQNGILKILHSGCFGWIARKWEKLTGEKLES